MNATNIEWTATPRSDGTLEPGFTANPVKYRDKATGKSVWACVKHSAGCAHCYAETLALRYGRGGPFTKAEMEKVEPYLCEKEAGQLLRSKKLAGKRVFVGDMTDIFGEWVPDAVLDRLFAVFALRPDVTFQLLTKRADRMADYFVTGRPWERIAHRMYGFHEYTGRAAPILRREADAWPIPNVWLGTSVENQMAADARIPHLLRTPAAVRFLSVEPLLGAVDLRQWLCQGWCPSCQTTCFVPGVNGPGLGCGGCGDTDARPLLSWVIVGGESGPGCRPCRPEWVRGIVGQCKAAGVPVFVKQMGGNVVTRNDMIEDVFDNGETGWPEPDMEHDIHGFREEYQGADCRIRLRDKKGGSMEEWPNDLRVRQFPEAPCPRD